MITIAKVLSAASSFVKVLRFGNQDINTPESVFPYGIQSRPIKNKRGIVAETQRKGKNVILGYILHSKQTKDGEIRVYATNNNGDEKFYIHLFNDGTCEIGGHTDNMVRYSKLETAFNQLKADFNNLVTLYNSHVHVGVTSGTSSSGTTVSQSSSSTADISAAKIDGIKTI